MTRLGPRRRLVLLAVLVLAALAIGGAANAYWQIGTGAGTADTAALEDLTLSPGTASATLYPGGSADVVVTVDNPNPVPVHLSSLGLDPSHGTGGFAVDALHAGCDVSVLGLAEQFGNGFGWSVPGSSGGQDGTLAITLSGALTMSTAAADACQGARFTVYLSVGP